MTHIVSRHLRIIPGQRDDDSAADAPSSDTRSGDFDYASLLGRRRALRRAGFDADAQGNAHPHASSPHEDDDDDAASSCGDDSGSSAKASRRSEPRSAIGAYDALPPSNEAGEAAENSTMSGAERQAISARVSHAAAPVVSAVFQRQQRIVTLLGSLAREIGAFCGDPSIANEGNWEVQLPLDQKLLPQTTLYLSLSRFRLQLRFDAPDTATRQLLLEHSGLLERELDAMLRAWGEARDIELTVW